MDSSAVARRVGLALFAAVALGFAALPAPATERVGAVVPVAASSKATPPSVASPVPPSAEATPESSGEDALFSLEESSGPAWDPFEPVNRGIFRFNHEINHFVINPVVRFYGWAVPAPAKRAVLRVFTNLNSPVVFVNDLLQLSPRRAGVTTARFVVNSSVGLAGIFDVASHFGLEGHEADFGQTLGKAGVGPGPYLVIPIMGPTDCRDAIGNLVDVPLRFDTWLLSPAAQLVFASSSGVAIKEEHLKEIRSLWRSSVDPYVAIRSVFLMSREAAVRGN